MAAAKKPQSKAAAPAAKSPAKPKPKAKPKSKSKSSAAIYTDPELRDKLKEEITVGDKGGKPGQWSARKAQLLAQEYEKAGGDYKNGKKKKTEAQQHLDSWTKEDWKTSDDQPADRDGGTTRYLPAEAWDQLTPAQRKATNAKKQAGSKEGKQFVANTSAARTARQHAQKSDEPTPTADESPAKPRTKAAPRKSAGSKAKTPRKKSS